MPRTTKAAGSVALVTGANRGIGLAFVQELAARGASKIYAAVREPAEVTGQFDGLPVEVVRLDVTDLGRGERRRGGLSRGEPAGQQRGAVHRHPAGADRDPDPHAARWR